MLRLVKSMKITSKMVHHLVELVLNQWKKNNIVTFKEDEAKVFSRAVEIVNQELAKELELDREVNTMMDKLEKTNPGEFQRYKMFPILKAKLAKERKMIL